MTRQMRATFCCPRCGGKIPAETPFSQWVRAKLLDSRNGLTVSDIDFIFHRYHHHGNRTVQFMMNVEVKTFNATVSDSQRDTLAMDHQANRTHEQSNRDSRGRIAGGTKKPPQVYSSLLKKMVTLNHLGWYLLQMDDECPQSSSAMWWSHKLISPDTLVKVLQLDLHPATFLPLTARRHKRESLPLFGEQA